MGERVFGSNSEQFMSMKYTSKITYAKENKLFSKQTFTVMPLGSVAFKVFFHRTQAW